MKAQALLSDLEKSLVAHVPAAVQAMGITEPVYCLRIWYHGTDTDGDRTPSLTLKSESLRKRLVAEKGDEAPYYLWCADECEMGDGVFRAEITDGTISGLCREWFQQLPKQRLPDDSGLLPLRKAVQRAAAALNHLDWGPCLAVTDDFVVVPADGSHNFCDDYGEMVASVPTAKLDLLRSRGFLWTEESRQLGSDGDLELDAS